MSLFLLFSQCVSHRHYWHNNISWQLRHNTSIQLFHEVCKLPFCKLQIWNNYTGKIAKEIMTLTKDNLYNVWEKSSDKLAESVGMLKLLILLFFQAACQWYISLWNCCHMFSPKTEMPIFENHQIHPASGCKPLLLLMAMKTHLFRNKPWLDFNFGTLWSIV